MAGSTVPDILTEIGEQKKVEVAELRQALSSESDHPLHPLLVLAKREGNRDTVAHPRRFEDALRAAGSAVNRQGRRRGALAVIAEVKRKSPSAGQIDAIKDPVALARSYEDAGCACISVLTDSKYFGGSLADLRAVVNEVRVPVLRKDFTISVEQICEAKAAGASAVLLIVSLLGIDETLRLYRVCEVVGIDCVVEVHDWQEAEGVLAGGVRILGINNRNLRTFQTDIAVAEQISPLVPENVICVGESGVKSSMDAHRMWRAGCSAVLIGEALVRASDVGQFMTDIRLGGWPDIKVCGVCSADVASQCVKSGATYIGLVRHEQSKRYVQDATTIGRICEAAVAAHAGVRIAAVFTHHSASELHPMGGFNGDTLKAVLKYRQTSGRTNMSIIFCSVGSDPELDFSTNGLREFTRSCSSLLQRNDVVLVDASHGSGQQQRLVAAATLVGRVREETKAGGRPSLRVFLAGGLDSVSVCSFLDQIDIDGVDASSSLETPPGSGSKDVAKISDFCTSVRRHFLNPTAQKL